MSPLFLVGCGLLVAAVLLGATGAPAAVWVLVGVAGLGLAYRGATTTPNRTIRSHSGASTRARGGRSRSRPAARRPGTTRRRR